MPYSYLKTIKYDFGGIRQLTSNNPPDSTIALSQTDSNPLLRLNIYATMPYGSPESSRLVKNAMQELLGQRCSKKDITLCSLVNGVPEDAVIFVMPRKHGPLFAEMFQTGTRGLLTRYQSLAGTDNLVYCPDDSANRCGCIEDIVAAEYKGLIIHRFDNKLSITGMLNIAHKRDPQVKQDYSDLFQKLVDYEYLIRAFSQKESHAFDENFVKTLNELVPVICQRVRKFARENTIENYAKFNEALLKDADYLKRSLDIVFRINDDDDLQNMFYVLAKADCNGPDRQNYITNLLELFFHYDRDTRTYLIDTLGEYKSKIIELCLALTIRMKDTAPAKQLVMENREDPKKICEAIQRALHCKPSKMASCLPKLRCDRPPSIVLAS